jgi:hypothetical protein
MHLTFVHEHLIQTKEHRQLRTDPCVGDPMNPALLSTFDVILTPPLATRYYWRHRLWFVHYSVQPVLARTLQMHGPCRRNDRVARNCSGKE